MEQDRPILFYDGFCNLCSGLVRFLIQRGGKKKFRFIPLQNIAEVAHFGVTADADPGSVALVEKGSVYYQSEAAIRCCRILGFPWNLAAVFRPVPRSLRDAVYRWIAGNRLRWFGRRDTCYFPDHDQDH